MIFTPLASSSAGNAYLLEDGQSKLLIECGVPYRRLQRLLAFQTTELCACLITHEHKDHAKCYMDLIKNGVPVYGSEGTAEALDCELLSTVASMKMLSVGSFDVIPFPVFHDAQEPIGFFVRSRADGERLLFATDTVNLAYRPVRPTIVAIECNYFEEILARSERMPDKVKDRIRNTHMEIDTTCRYLSELDLSTCREVYLMHLSDACSNESLFTRRATAVCQSVPVRLCPKEVDANTKL